MVCLGNILSELRGIGKVRFADLRAQGLVTVEDLLQYAPIRYEDRTACHPLAALENGKPCLVRARVRKASFYGSWRRRMRILQVQVEDETGSALLVFFNQAYLVKTFVADASFYIYGQPKIAAKQGSLPVFQQPDYERIEEDQEVSIHMGRVVPVYRRIGSCSSRVLRSAVHTLLRGPVEWPPDPLPQELRRRLGLISRAEALVSLHFPHLNAGGMSAQEGNPPQAAAAGPVAIPAEAAAGGSAGVSPAAKKSPYSPVLIASRLRLKFEEMFHFYLALLDQKERISAAGERKPSVPGPRFEEWKRETLPFALTRAQERVLAEILADMASPRPMCRLLQGDVGSGKTVVALVAILAAVSEGRQAALMAPTEVLAEQHFLTFQRWLGPTRLRVACLSSQVPAAERAAIAKDLEQGRIALAVGTQALIQQSTRFRDLGLAIVDEQHRFGVLQRFELGIKGAQPDLLAMTATPIPRSLALTLYGDLDVSVLDELPPGRHPVRTRSCRDSERSRVLAQVREHVARGHQAYIVCPVVQASEKLELRDVERSYEKLAADVFPDLKLGLLHGRLPSEKKLQVLADFQAGGISILVCTTVVEVGIDVPNATLMVVENAERFGLAQLHQLRGRVGRGNQPGECLLLSPDSAGEEARARLQVLCETNDGFRIAEEDLARRGPGDLAGLRQSGLDNFRFIDLVHDRKIIEAARREARQYFHAAESRGTECRHILDRARSLWKDRQDWQSGG